MRPAVECLAAKLSAEPDEAADHFIVNDKNVVFATDLCDLLKVGSGRNDDPAGAHHRLGDEGRDRIRTFPDDQLLELDRQSRRKRLFALTVVREAIMVRASGLEKSWQRQIKINVVVNEAGHRAGRDCQTVERPQPTDDLLFLWPAERVVHVPDQLDLAVIRFRSGIAKEHLRNRYRRDLL